VLLGERMERDLVCAEKLDLNALETAQEGNVYEILIDIMEGSYFPWEFSALSVAEMTATIETK
jgi:hypothetical protein